MTTQQHCHTCGHPLPEADEETPLAKLDRTLRAANAKQAAVNKLRQILKVHGDTPELRKLIDELGLTPGDLKLKDKAPTPLGTLGTKSRTLDDDDSATKALRRVMERRR